MNAKYVVLLALLLVPAGEALASDHGHDGTRVSSACCDPPTRWASRHSVNEARLAITTDDGDVTLLLTDRVVAFQLSERTYQKLRKKLRDHETEDEDDNALGTAIKAVVFSTVRTLVGHSAECPVRAIESVELLDGRLVFTTEDGKRVFEHLEINDEDELASFSPRDAQAFVQAFRRVKAGRRS